MKKTFAISFLFIFLCANTEMGQLLKLPLLLHYYLEHHDNDGNGISFADFLHKHYNEENSHPAPDSEHEKLPFKSQELGFYQTTLAYQAPFSFELQTERPTTTKGNIIYFTAFHSTSFLSRIWQPPKFC